MLDGECRYCGKMCNCFCPDMAVSGTVERRLPVQIRVLPHGEGLELPSAGTSGSAGLDLRAAVPDGVWERVYPGEAHRVPTGICVRVPEGHAGLVLSRSGLAAEFQVAITNSPGLIDPR